MAKELWKIVARCREYQVSNHGRIMTSATGYIKKPTIRPDGKLYVNLSSGQKSTVCSVHSLVAEAFIGSRPSGSVVVFNDRDPRNCCASNLGYARRAEVVPSTPPVLRSLSPLDVSRIRYLLEKGVPGKTVAGAFGVSAPQISLIKNNKKWASIAK